MGWAKRLTVGVVVVLALAIGAWVLCIAIWVSFNVIGWHR